MPKRGQRTPKGVLGDPHDSESLYHYLQRFLAWLHEKNYSAATIAGREAYLRYFIVWCIERGLARPHDITKPIIERYQRHLFLHRKQNGEPLSTRSQHTHITPLRAWFKWLAKQNYILYNPASDLDMPRMERRLPKHILTVTEVETVLRQPDIATVTGLRDRAIMEVLYSTGIRRMEAINLTLFDIDVERGTLMVRQGKGKKDRMLPIGERALRWVEKYCDEARGELATHTDGGTLFLSHLGEPFAPNRLTQLVRDYIDAAQLHKRGSCHLFRHTMATLMLEAGADIRYIQAMLGHAELSTTQIYTQVSIRKLKDIHTATHPAKMAHASRAPIDTPDSDTEAQLLALLDVEGLDEAD